MLTRRKDSFLQRLYTYSRMSVEGEKECKLCRLRWRVREQNIFLVLLTIPDLVRVITSKEHKESVQCFG